jgi:hypothetical protein
MSKSSEKVIRWRKKTKERMVKSMGGECVCCSYKKCNSSLSFHHLDPSTKSFGFGAIRANIKSWSTIVQELKKCVLVCNNCHHEIHDGMTKVPKDAKRFNPIYENYKLMESEKSECPICHGEKPKWQKTCSHSCAASLKGKVDWGEVNLHKLILEEKRPLRSIGRDLGVSDSAVRKRAKKLGIIK